ncbi:MAG: hypothetical protein QM757_16670 [Paludibaculum sp.]
MPIAEDLAERLVTAYAAARQREPHMSPEDKAAVLQQIAKATIEDAMHIAAVGAVKAKKERVA